MGYLLKSEIAEDVLAAARRRFPSATEAQYCSALTTVWYLLTAEVKSEGGPTIREHAAIRYFSSIAGTQNLEDAIRLVVDPALPIFASIPGECDELFIQTLDEIGPAVILDSDPRDLRSLEGVIQTASRRINLDIEGEFAARVFHHRDDLYRRGRVASAGGEKQLVPAGKLANADLRRATSLIRAWLTLLAITPDGPVAEFSMQFRIRKRFS